MMETGLSSKDSSWFLYTFPALLGSSTLNLADKWVLFSIFAAIVSVAAISWWFAAGGTAWKNGRNAKGSVAIPGPRGLPVLGSLLTLSHGKLAHRALAAMAERQGAKSLMAFSIGSTPAVVASDPHTAREILTSVHFADRPVKQSARLLLFERAIGFAPNGTYWRLLRRIASTHLFAPKRIAAHEPGRQLDAAVMLAGISAEQAANGSIAIRKHLQGAALNNIMGSVFGKRYDVASDGPEVAELREMVGEGFELLGAFNWSDFLPLLNWVYDPIRIRSRCGSLVPRVRSLVKGIIDEHKGRKHGGSDDAHVGDNADFVDVLLSLQGEEQLQEDDMIAVLWEMIFRGTDTTALLTEWTMAELVLNPDVQSKVRAELEGVVGRDRTVQDADIARLPYLQAVVKESLRVHPPGPLLSWARLATEDVHLSNGMVVPAGTTAMVNMWSITHDPAVWADPTVFKPERFVESVIAGGESVDVRGSDLRLAPFGAGRRVCPGKSLGLATVNLWVAKLVHHFHWSVDPAKPVDLSEVLKLSCEMKAPLSAVAVSTGVPF